MVRSQKRIKSKIAWTTTLTLIVLILKQQFGLKLEGFDTYITLLGAILVGFGVWNNPESKDYY